MNDSILYFAILEKNALLFFLAVVIDRYFFLKKKVSNRH